MDENKKPKTILKTGKVSPRKVTDIKPLFGNKIIELPVVECIAKEDRLLSDGIGKSKTKLFHKGDILTIIIPGLKAGVDNDEVLFINERACEDRNILIIRLISKYADSLIKPRAHKKGFKVMMTGKVREEDEEVDCYMVCPYEKKENVVLWVTKDYLNQLQKEETDQIPNIYPISPPPNIVYVLDHDPADDPEFQILGMNDFNELAHSNLASSEAGLASSPYTIGQQLPSHAYIFDDEGLLDPDQSPLE